MEFTLSQDCPHCFSKKAGFKIVGCHTKTSQDRFIFLSCNVCHGCIINEVHVGENFLNRKGETINVTFIERLQNAGFSRMATIIDNYPKPEANNIPSHLPKEIAACFSEAEMILNSDIPTKNSASAMDRRALELATIDKAPEHSRLSLKQRIDKLVENNLITPSLKEWAHRLRIVGNDAVHDIQGVTKEEAVEVHELTRYILIYLYTLPEQVRLAKEGK